MSKYDSIINLPHYEPKNHKRMSIEARCAQFSPYSALTGYEDKIYDAGKDNVIKKDLTDDEKEVINSKLSIALENKNKCTSVLYFNKDKYIEKRGYIKRIDLINGKIIFEDRVKVKIDDILDINCFDKDKNGGTI